jgi:hypothetical protein
MSLTNTHADKGAGRRARRWTKRKPTRLSRCTMCRRSRATHPVVRTGDAKTSNFTVVGRFLLRSLVESTLGFPPKGVASNRNGPCLHDSSSSQPTAAISVASSVDRTTSSQRTTKHLSASSRMFAMLRRTSLPNDAPHVAAKHPAAELTVAMGVTAPEGVTTSSELTRATPRHRRVERSRCSEEPRSRTMRLTLPRSTLQQNSPWRWA